MNSITFKPGKKNQFKTFFKEEHVATLIVNEDGLLYDMHKPTTFYVIREIKKAFKLYRETK